MKKFFGILAIILSVSLLIGCKADPTTDPDRQATESGSEQSASETDSKTEPSAPEVTPSPTPYEDKYPIPTGMYGGKVAEFVLRYDNHFYVADGKHGYLSDRPDGSSLCGQVMERDDDKLPMKELAAANLYVGMNLYYVDADGTILVEYGTRNYLVLSLYKGDLKNLMADGFEPETDVITEAPGDVEQPADETAPADDGSDASEQPAPSEDPTPVVEPAPLEIPAPSAP